MSEISYATIDQLVRLYGGEGGLEPKARFMNELKAHYIRAGKVYVEVY